MVCMMPYTTVVTQALVVVVSCGWLRAVCPTGTPERHGLTPTQAGVLVGDVLDCAHTVTSTGDVRNAGMHESDNMGSAGVFNGSPDHHPATWAYRPSPSHKPACQARHA